MVHFSIKLFEDEENSNFVQLERVNFVQQNNLDGLLEACKNRNIISLQYENFWWDNIEFVIEPYLLKQFRNRWYLIAKITKIIKAEHQNTRVTEGDIYNFSLDRILNIDNTKNTFKDPNFDANKFYKDCFGILTPFSQDNEQVQEVVLCFEKIQGKYIKRLPLHHSQRIFKATKDHIFVRLKLYITYDFVQEILHFGETVKVISPQFFKEKIMKEVSNQIVKYYDENDELPSRSDIY
jgi:predicted DNA-binding transcriptional regulator YafY